MPHAFSPDAYGLNNPDQANLLAYTLQYQGQLFFEDQLTQAGFFIGNSLETIPICL